MRRAWGATIVRVGCSAMPPACLWSAALLFATATTAGAAPVARRPQLTDIRQEAVEIVRPDAVLEGTLYVPARGSGRPAVVVVGGSSWKTRHDVRVLTRRLVALGFVTLAFDQRGFGASTGSRNVPFEVTARDAIAAARAITAHPAVEEGMVGLVGASRGGWVAPLAASLSEDVRFLILLVPPAVTPAEQEMDRRLFAVRAAGRPLEDVELAERFLRAGWEWARTGAGWDEYRQLWEQAVQKRLPRLVFGPEKKGAEGWQWVRMNMFHDPCPVLGRVRVPVLAIFGGADTTVSAAINRPRLAQCLAEGGHRDLTAETIEGAGHALASLSEEPEKGAVGGSERALEVLWRWSSSRWPALVP